MKMKKKDKNQVTEGMTEEAVSSKEVQTKKKKRKKAPIIIAIIIIVFLVLRMVSCALMPDTGAIVTTTCAVRGDLQESISTSGKVASEEKKIVFAPVSGKLAQVNVVAGDAVAAGDVLISYDMEEMEKQLQQAELQQNKSEASYNGVMADNRENQYKLSEANTNLGVLEQQITDYKAYIESLQDELSKNQRDTSNSLLNQSYELSVDSAEVQKEISALDPNASDYAAKLKELQDKQQDINEEITYNQYLQQTVASSDYAADMEKKIAEAQETLAGFEEYKAEMEAQKNSSKQTVLDTYDKQQYSADKELAQMTYETAQEDYNTAKQGIVAAFDGIVTECTAVQGATVTDGMQLLTLENSNAVKVSFDASKNDVEKLAVGQKTEITISGHTYEGEVSRINRMAVVNASNTPMVGVEVHITTPDDKIILGMEAKLAIYTNFAENALLIPVEVINADKDGDFLYVVENGVVVRKPILCGISTDTYTEVLEGITEADQIITMSYTDLEEGMAVTVMPDDQSSIGAGVSGAQSGLSVTVTTEN